MDDVSEKPVEDVDEREEINKKIETRSLTKFEVFYLVLLALIIFSSLIGTGLYFFVFRENIN